MHEVWAAIVGGIFLLISVIMNRRDARRSKELESRAIGLAIGRSVANVIGDFADYYDLHLAVRDLFKATKIDRFLLLIAVNKKVDFNDITVIYEQHENDDEPVKAQEKYKHITVDDEYRSMLKKVEAFGPVTITTESMPKCVLRDFYEIEAVHHSRVTFIQRIAIDDDNDAVIFSSAATHHQDPFTKHEETQARLMYESAIRPTVAKILESKVIKL